MNKWILGLMLLLSTQALAKGKIQNEDIKSLSELVSAGGVMSQLPNDTKIYVTANGINTQLSTAIQSGVIGGGSGGSSGVNILKNPGFEVGTTNWTNTGGTLTPVSSGPNLLIGQGSATYQATAGGQNMSSISYTIPNGLYGANCAVGILYQGGDTNLTLQAFDGTNVLASATLQNQALPTMQFATFVCPSSGSLQLRIVSSASSALIALDQMFLGQNTLSQVSQAQFVGTVTWPPTVSCVWSTQATSPFIFPFSATCPSPTIVSNGQITAASSNPTANPSFNLVNAPPGNYLVTYTGAFVKSGGASNFAYLLMTDNSTNFGFTSLASSASPETGSSTVTGSISYSTAGTHTISLAGYVANGSDSIILDSTIIPTVATVYYFPAQPQQLVTPQTVNWLVNAVQTGVNNVPLATTGTVSSFLEISDGTSALTIAAQPGSLPVQIPCSGSNPSTGVTCSSGFPDIGVVFNLPAAGDVQVCANFNVLTGTGGAGSQDAFDIVETSNTSPTPIQQAFTSDYMTWPSVNFSAPFSGCGIMHFTTPGQKTLRLEYLTNVSGTWSQHLVLTDNNPLRVVTWTIRPLTQTIPAPIINNSITTKGPGAWNLEAAIIAPDCSSGTCTIAASSSNFLTSVVHSSTGIYNINFAPGVFQNNAYCICNGILGGSNATRSCIFSSGEVLLTDPANTFQDGEFNIMCFGN